MTKPMANLSLSERISSTAFSFTSAAVLGLHHCRHNWRITYVTKSIAGFGFSFEHLTEAAADFFDLIHPKDRERVREIMSAQEERRVHRYSLPFCFLSPSGQELPVISYHSRQQSFPDQTTAYSIAVLPLELPQSHGSLLGDCDLQQMVFQDLLDIAGEMEEDPRLIPALLSQVGRYLHLPQIFLSLKTSAHRQFTVPYSWSRSDAVLPTLPSSLLSHLFDALGANPCILLDQKNGRPQDEPSAFPFSDSLVFPMAFHTAHHQGLLCFAKAETTSRWQQSTVRFLQMVSGFFSSLLLRQESKILAQNKELSLDKLKYQDPLTHLGNRRDCKLHLQKALQQALMDNKVGYLVLVDLDDFSFINQCYGQEYGDAALVTIVNWMTRRFKAAFHLSRLGNDEIALIVPSGEQSRIRDLLHILMRQVRKPWRILDKEFYCTFSIGVSEFFGYERDAMEVIRNAEVAVSEAKRQGKGSCLTYRKGMERRMLRRGQVGQLLQQAMKNNYEGFLLHYQPILDVSANQILGAEALLRISHQGQLFLPKDFLPLANDLGFIVPIGEYVLHRVTQECHKLLKLGQKDFQMHLNVSMRQILLPNFCQLLGKILERSGLPLDHFSISIQEADASADLRQIKTFCKQLKRLGFQIVLDDLGGGNFPLTLLQDLPVDHVKISTQFMQRFDGDGFTRKTIDHLVELAHALGKRVSITGIENEMQFDYAMRSGADELQGFYIYTAQDALTLKQILHS